MIKQELDGDASTVLGLLTLYSVKRLLTVYIFVVSGYDHFGSVVYRGRVSVDARSRDDDFIGFVFSYQSNKRFYVVSWKRHVYSAPGRPGLTIMVTVIFYVAVLWRSWYCVIYLLQRVHSNTGPSKRLQDALWDPIPSRSQGQVYLS